jgi:hypothetical protein
MDKKSEIALKLEGINKQPIYWQFHNNDDDVLALVSSNHISLNLEGGRRKANRTPNVISDY